MKTFIYIIYLSNIYILKLYFFFKYILNNPIYIKKPFNINIYKTLLLKNI